MKEKNVVVEYIVPSESFTVEYKDNEEWLDAAGTWEDDGYALTIPGEFQKESSAVYSAQRLFKMKNIPVRVIKEEKD